MQVERTLSLAWFSLRGVIAPWNLRVKLEWCIQNIIPKKFSTPNRPNVMHFDPGIVKIFTLFLVKIVPALKHTYDKQVTARSLFGF